ncbi:hypothetical protein BKA67DRAFT_655664 [Truncatella angustata]|uniref:Uncharacterized protein n=1 Tax=Truncatella angustata TaxID=152316 RepID=A0A9P8USU1_9PEZI|nr:uncharacterized protein BKA67DRAFT_655664 [Truncatella angustata]KAH6657390.1 hypothetical protein BKA67DRAFT_655664 [Truncatella angustata]
MSIMKVRDAVELRDLDGIAPRTQNGVTIVYQNPQSPVRITGFAVPNTLAERTRAQFRQHRRIWMACGMVVLVVVTIAGILGGLFGSSLMKDHGGSDTTLSPMSSHSIFVAITSAPSSQFTTSTSTIAPLLWTTAPVATTTVSPAAATPSTFNTCSLNNFHRNASFVGVYDPLITTDQFTLIPATGPGECCQNCHRRTRTATSCNGWAWLEDLCWIVYGYPGMSPNETCPKGYPMITIETGGPEKNLAGLGPCGRD